MIDLLIIIFETGIARVTCLFSMKYTKFFVFFKVIDNCKTLAFDSKMISLMIVFHMIPCGVKSMAFCTTKHAVINVRKHGNLSCVHCDHEKDKKR